ncbi:GntR family transcriptional regulator [Streptomyces sp. ISL-12]|uniref:GntR family transcriptional regulator n=1 Tax=Streptomyces sp. ISL-12 TaxID=2819177 RepID=UPI001BED3888|nr:GntR family transcriptional regulator [Streptomyces sp. ISL-12]MBT2412078.1 GntR family transcriptional regulator [Streptomyces sp. ISL-12]
MHDPLPQNDHTPNPLLLADTRREQARQLTNILRRRIETREWPPGHTFSHAELVNEFSLGIHAICKVAVPAVRTLREEGLLESRPRLGIRIRIEGESWNADDEHPGIPHDVHIEKILREHLHRGIYRPGEQFPPIFVLAEEFGVSAATIRKALRPMQKQGLLEVRNTNKRYVSAAVVDVSSEELLHIPPRRNPGKAKLLAFGEKRSLAEWAKDSRCTVSYKVLYSRYYLGWDLEKALRTPNTSQGRRERHTVTPKPEHSRLTDSEPLSIKKMLSAAIADGTYQEGHVICVTDIALRKNRPKSQVLQALRALNSESLLGHHPEIGYFVSRKRMPQVHQPRKTKE